MHGEQRKMHSGVVHRCFVIQRQHTRALFSISKDLGYGRTVIAFRRAADAKMFLSWIVKYDHSGNKNESDSDRYVRPRQPLVVMEFPDVVLEDACVQNALDFCIIEGEEGVVEK